MKDMEQEKSIERRGEIVLYQPDANITMEVRPDASYDTVWLNCQQMAELFERKPPVTHVLAAEL